MTATEYFRSVSAELSDILGSAGEGKSAAAIIFEDVAGYDRKWLFINGDREITDYMQSKIARAVDAVRAGEPVQYAVGSALFMGMHFKVTPDVLIPRFETEELVDIIVDAWSSRSDLSVLDIGTGSGCIAISLARALPFSQVTAMDVSDGALAVASANAKSLAPKMQLVKTDIFTATPTPESFDIIVSNPPYVLDSEAEEMDARVRDKEPSLALFVPDNDPLRFYIAITRYAATALKSGGALYFEINSKFGEQMCALMEREGFCNVKSHRDYRGNVRFCSGYRK